MDRLQQIKTDWIEEAETYQFRQLALEEKDIDWLIEQAEEFERYKKYVMYFAGKDKVNDIRLAMQDRELD